MKIYYNAERFNNPEKMPSEKELAEMEGYLDKSVMEIQGALASEIVWAKVPILGDGNFRVRNVRILEIPLEKQPFSQLFLTYEVLQVELLEGWRSAQLIWTDENIIEEIKGIQ